MPGTISFLKQSFPGAPTFTEKDVPDLQGKVCGAHIEHLESRNANVNF